MPTLTFIVYVPAAVNGTVGVARTFCEPLVGPVQERSGVGSPLLLASCVTTTSWLATISVPERTRPVAFVVVAKVTVPVPDPDAPDLIVSQDVLLVAAQLHVLIVDNEIKPVEALRGAMTLVDDRL
jgi:hypothetical protein